MTYQSVPTEFDLVFSVSEFVDLLNQTLEYAYPTVPIEGELANYKISKNRWVYFDLKDQFSTVRFFGTVYQLPGPLEDGMKLRVKGSPRLHKNFGFSVNILSINPVGEGTIKRAAELLLAKLSAEGLFDEQRKRVLPYPPKTIGLITSRESAAYADFVKVLGHRWPAMSVSLIDVVVQGETAPAQISSAIEQFGLVPIPPDVIVLTRGGGSAEDLAAFSTEIVTRAVASSRVPILVAIGHEIDLSLAELAADQRASTPSNAAELLVPERRQVLKSLIESRVQAKNLLLSRFGMAVQQVASTKQLLSQTVAAIISDKSKSLASYRQLVDAYNPMAVLSRGYVIVRRGHEVVRSASGLRVGEMVDLQFADGNVKADIVDKRKD